MSKSLATKPREDREGREHERDDLKKSIADVKTAPTEELVRLPASEVPSSWRRRLKLMRANSINNIPVKSFIMEAIEDLIAKYDRGEGKYPMLDE